MRLPRLSPTAYRRITLAALVSLVVISVVGAGVRLTGSGLGCSTWPSCEPDSFTPHSASDVHAMIEFANRMLNVVVGLLAIATVVGARLRSPRRADLFRWSLGLFAWVLSNGLVGALVVWLHLSPISVIAHFALALAAIWNALVLHRRAGEEPASGRAVRALATDRFVALARVLVAATVVVLVTGTLVTGSGPHAGDESADRLGFELGNVVRIHALTVIAFLVLTVALARLAHRGDTGPAVVQRVHELLIVLVAQGAIGYWQYFTGVPALLVAFHVLGAVLVWMAVLRLWFSLHTREPAADVTAVDPATDTAAGPDTGAEPQVATT